MIELFKEIPIEIKDMITKIIDYTFDNFELQQCAEIVAEFANSCTVEEEKNFIDFYFTLKMEQLKNEDNND